MAIRLTQKDIEDLKRAGYSEMQIQTAVRELENDELSQSSNQVQQQRIQNSRMNSHVSSFSTRTDDNLIRWQLELNDILERAEHILRGDVPRVENGNVYWDKNPNPEDNPLNVVGVNEIMKILAMYVNRNTILSDYTNDEINIKVYDFGREANNLIFMRDDDFGLDSVEKRKSYPIIVREIVDIVHSAYKRALDGAEKRSLREMITVTQATNTQAQLGNGVTVNNQGMPQKERGLLNPMRYVKGKYL